jgi:hypothetical protein
LSSSKRTFLSASSDEFVERLPRKLLPISREGNTGDILFDAWTCTLNSDGQTNVNLTERGYGCMRGVHSSWIEMIKSGSNLIVDYTICDKALFKDLMGRIRAILPRNFNRLIIVEVKYSYASIREDEKENTIYPNGYALSTYKKFKELEPVLPKSAHRITLDADNRKEELCDTAYRFICRTGLV